MLVHTLMNQCDADDADVRVCAKPRQSTIPSSDVRVGSVVFTSVFSGELDRGVVRRVTECGRVVGLLLYVEVGRRAGGNGRAG